MSKFSKGNNSGKIRWFFFNFQSGNPLIIPYQLTKFQSPSPMILFEIPCWQDFILILSKDITPEREITRTRKNYGSAFLPWEIHIWNFKTLACTVNKIWHTSDFILIFFKGHNSRKGDNSDKKETTGQLFCHEKSIYEISKPWHARLIRYGIHQISFWFFSRDITPEKEITRTRKKRYVDYFSMRNPYMKFQNPSMHGSWRTDGRTHNPKPICPVNFFEVRDTKMQLTK